MMEWTARIALLMVSWLSLLSLTPGASTRTLESPFALSADTRSEFSTTFHVLSAGRIVVEATWNAQQDTAHRLRVALIRPDSSEAAQREGPSPLRLEYAIAETEADKFNSEPLAKWSVKIINSAAPERHEVSGKLRLTVPAATRMLEDTQFTLLGTGNAQEIPVRVPTAGRVTVEVEWQNDSLAANESLPLTVSLEHPGMNRIYVRRTVKSPLRLEQQITATDMELGHRIIVRVQNDNTARVKGRVKVTFSPAL
ncbi:MAG: hypothetical protein ABI882_20575 [Acidobacteriota bacterium]